MQSTALYFDEPGKQHTDATLKAARERAEQLGLNQIVLATTHGYTAERAKAVFDGMDVELIAVSICAAFDDQCWTMTSDERRGLEEKGIKVLTCLHSLGDDVSEAFGETPANRIVRETLYRFCQGMKVAVEIAIMAAEAGLLSMDREIIAIAGTGEGADTAVVLHPAYARTFKKLKIREILAKPR